MRFSILFVLIAFYSSFVFSQELRCQVVVNGERVQTTDKQIFTDMQNAFTQFLNTRKWTNDVFKNEERIACNILINLNPSSSIGVYSATVQIRSSRPVYGTSYDSPLINFFDKYWEFEYIPSQPLEYNETGLSTNLTAMLAFYAYIVIGMDYDTFSKLGGTPYYQKALTIVNNAQQFSVTGWKSLDNDIRNRYWLSENLLSQQMAPLREGLYTYHRLAMDQFSSNPDEARNKILDVLNKIVLVNKQRPVAVLVNLFFDTKGGELIKIFSEGDPTVRQQAYSVLIQLDPTNTEKYKKIIGN